MNILDYIKIPTAFAQAATTTGATTTASTSKPISTFVSSVDKVIINPLIILMFAVALMYFLYGTFMFLVNADDASERELGKSHILWGLVGMFIMFAVFTILHIIQNTLGTSLVKLPS